MEQWRQSTIEEWTHQSFTNLGSWYYATWMVTTSSLWKPIQKELKGCNRPLDFPDGASSKESACQCRRHKGHGFDSWVRRSPGGWHGNPLQYSCLENPHGQKSLAGYSPWWRDGNTRPPYLPPEKTMWVKKYQLDLYMDYWLGQNWKKSTLRVYIVILLI